MSSSPQPKKWRQTTWAIVVAAGVIIGICSGSLYLFETFNAGATTASSSATATAAQLAQGTATPSATPHPPVVITKNQPLQCISSFAYPCTAMELVLDTIAIYPGQGTMDWKFTLTNTFSGSVTYQFSQAELEDPATNKWEATGQIQEPFNLAAGQTKDVTGTLRLIPTPNTPYTLHVNVSGNQFADTDFTFTRDQTT